MIRIKIFGQVVDKKIFDSQSYSIVKIIHFFGVE